MRKLPIYILVLLTCQSCFLFSGSDPKPIDPEPLPEFNNGVLYSIPDNVMNEASGIVASKSMKDNIWVIEDSDNPASLHLLSNEGAYQGKIDLPLQNRDWEDLSAGPGPIDGQNYLYIGETGDNAEVYGTYTIYRLPEPSSLDQSNIQIDAINFRYDSSESGLDVEANFVDPITKDIYLIGKKYEFLAPVYRLKFPYSTTSQNTAEYLGTIAFPLLTTAADISEDGKELIIKNYNAISYRRIGEEESIFEALSRTRDLGLPYYSDLEEQGEAICFDYNNDGYFTLSEKRTTAVSLHYYSRKPTAP